MRNDFCARQMRTLGEHGVRTLTGQLNAAFEDVLQKSTPKQMCQLILYIGNSEGYVDGFVKELTSAKRR